MQHPGSVLHSISHESISSLLDRRAQTAASTACPQLATQVKYVRLPLPQYEALDEGYPQPTPNANPDHNPLTRADHLSCRSRDQHADQQRTEPRRRHCCRWSCCRGRGAGRGRHGGTAAEAGRAVGDAGKVCAFLCSCAVVLGGDSACSSQAFASSRLPYCAIFARGCQCAYTAIPVRHTSSCSRRRSLSPWSIFALRHRLATGRNSRTYESPSLRCFELITTNKAVQRQIRFTNHRGFRHV